MMDPLPRASVCAVRRAGKDGAMFVEPKVRVAWSPRGNPAQMRLLKCQVFEIFFGGARGGGKTDGVLGEFGAHASRYGKDAIGLMVRRTRAVMKLIATLRSGAGVPVGLRATGNPGGPGHQWVKARYIDPAPLGNCIVRDPLTGLERRMRG